MNAVSPLSAITPRPAYPSIALPEPVLPGLQNGAWAVFNLSGGKDSSAALFAGMNALDAIGHPRDRRLAIHADIGRAEWDSTPAMVERLAELAGIELMVVRRKAGDLFDRWEQRFEAGKARYEALEIYNLIGPWSSASLRFCTSEAKAQVIGPALVRRLAGQTIVQILGLRRDESAARSRTSEWEPDIRFASPNNRAGAAMLLWHPIVHWTTAEVFAAHAALGIPLHEAYVAYGSSRLSCRFCILQSQADARASASAPSNNAALIHLVELEARSTFSFQPGRWLADIAPDRLPSALRRDIGRAKKAAGERRAREAALPQALRFVKGWPPRVPTPQEARAIAGTRAAILAHHDLANHYPTDGQIRERFAELIARTRSGVPA